MINIIIQNSDSNTVIQGGSEVCIIDGKKYVNEIEVEYD